MAKKSDIKAPGSSMRRGSAGKIFVWIILVLLIIGLAGFGANGIGGSINAIGSVGKTEITVQDFQRALQQELNFETRRRGAPVSLQQARLEGIDQRVINVLAGTAALSEETKELGISVGDEEVANQLRVIPAFQGAGGQFNRDSYEFALRQNGVNASDFEEELRVGAARTIMQQSVTGGLTVPDTYAETIYNFVAERRSFRWALIDEALVSDEVEEPTDADLASFHDAQGAQFLTPEIRRVTYAWLTPEMLLETIDVDEAELQRLYEARAAQYNQPERRLVERLGFSDMATAAAAKAQIEAGETTFDALVEERGLSLDDVDQGEVARADLTADIAEAVFALNEPGITAPVQTSLGPVLFRVYAVLEASTVPFEEAREELVSEFTSDRARRIIEDEITVIDDLLVGGATLEELADETPMQVGTLDFGPNTSEGIAAYDEFRTEIARLTDNDFPEVRTLDDGGIFAARLDEIVPPMVPPLADIREEVAEAWRADQIAQKLETLGTSMEERLRGGTRMASMDLEAMLETDMLRTDFLQGAPLGMLGAIFDLEDGGVSFVQGPNGVSALVELTAITPPDLTDEDAQAFTAQINASVSQSLSADVFETFSQAVRNRHGLTLDQTAINAVLSQMGGGGHGG
ncbi:MAG: SurA N-terminal domain-containing protein [Litoreibacter sp.]|nr:SurA N-terminal domain-containing protein [Litoreibacter sp.]